MKTLEKCVLEQITIPEVELKAITSRFQPRLLHKNEFFLKSGTISRELAYIESGYLRLYDHVDGREVTLGIGMEGSFMTSLSSFVFETVNFWNIQAVTDCQLLVISRSNHMDLTEKYRRWLEFDNLLLARAYTQLEKTMFDQLHTTAKQRFEALLKSNPQVFNHIPLNYIASMLGITPETLSRLRKDLSVSS